MAKPQPLPPSKPARREITLADLDVLPPSGVVLAAPNPDAQMASLLTEQYHKATGGMVEVLKFGALIIDFEASMERRGFGPHADQNGAGRPKGGLREWLRTHAPQVNHSSAMRLKAVTESIAAEYEQIVGPKVAKQFALPTLVTTPAADLPEKARAKQLELFSYVSGTSQRSWLDRFTPAKRKGGAQVKGEGKDTAPEKPPGWSEEQWARYQSLSPEMRKAVDLWRPTLDFLHRQTAEEETCIPHLPKAERDELAAVQRQLAKLLSSTK